LFFDYLYKIGAESKNSDKKKELILHQQEPHNERMSITTQMDFYNESIEAAIAERKSTF
jgi:hypothetical protein